MTSPLQLGEWESKTFGEEIIERRRARERAIAAMQKGALVTIEPLDAPASRSDRSPTAGRDVAPQVPAPRSAKRARGSFAATAAAVAVVVLALAGAVVAIAMR